MRTRLLLLAIAFVIFLAEAEIDIVVPSFPGLMEHFGVSVAQTELVLSINLISHGAAGLIVGWLTDVWGKRKTLIAGLLLFFIGSLFTVFASTFDGLLIGRALQGAGMAAPMVIGYLLIIEGAAKEEKVRRVALLNGVANMSLAFTPAIGSLLAVLLGWRANFQILLLLAALGLSLVVILVPKETRSKNFAFALAGCETGYLQLLKDPRQRTLIFSTFFLPAGWVAFVGFAPILYVDAMGTSVKTYGLHQGTIALIYGVVSLFLFRISERISERPAICLSICFIILSILGLAAVFFSSLAQPIIVTVLLLIGSIGSIYLVNLTQVLAVSYQQEAGGKIMALITLGRWFIAAIVLQVSGALYEYHQLIVLLAIALIWLLGLLHIVTSRVLSR